MQRSGPGTVWKERTCGSGKKRSGSYKNTCRFEIIRLYENHEVAGHGVNHESMYGRWIQLLILRKKSLKCRKSGTCIWVHFAAGVIDIFLVRQIRCGVLRGNRFKNSSNDSGNPPPAVFALLAPFGSLVPPRLPLQSDPYFHPH